MSFILRRLSSWDMTVSPIKMNSSRRQARDIFVGVFGTATGEDWGRWTVAQSHSSGNLESKSFPRRNCGLTADDLCLLKKNGRCRNRQSRIRLSVFRIGSRQIPRLTYVIVVSDLKQVTGWVIINVKSPVRPQNKEEEGWANKIVLTH